MELGASMLANSIIYVCKPHTHTYTCPFNLCVRTSNIYIRNLCTVRTQDIHIHFRLQSIHKAAYHYTQTIHSQKREISLSHSHSVSRSERKSLSGLQIFTIFRIPNTKIIKVMNSKQNYYLIDGNGKMRLFD